MSKIKAIVSHIAFILGALVLVILVPTLFLQYKTYQAVVDKPVCEVHPAPVVVEVTPTPEVTPTATPVPSRTPVGTSSAN